jgi:hypothetical protein
MVVVLGSSICYFRGVVHVQEVTSSCDHAVTLSKVKKKTKEWKGGLIVTAHKLLEE